MVLYLYPHSLNLYSFFKQQIKLFDILLLCYFTIINHLLNWPWCTCICRVWTCICRFFEINKSSIFDILPPLTKLYFHKTCWFIELVMDVPVFAEFALVWLCPSVDSDVLAKSLSICEPFLAMDAFKVSLEGK